MKRIVKLSAVVFVGVVVLATLSILALVIWYRTAEDRATVDGNEFLDRVERELPLGSTEDEVIEFLRLQSERGDLNLFYCKGVVRDPTYPTPVFEDRSISKTAVTAEHLQSCHVHGIGEYSPSEIQVSATNTRTFHVCTVRFAVYFRFDAVGELKDVLLETSDACF